MTVKNIGLKIVIILLFSVNLYAQDKSTISVYGTGTILVQPDIVQITISVSKTEKTTRLAQQEVSKMVRSVLSILKENKIEDSNISTASLRFRPEYEYKLSRRVLSGQRAEQIITFTVDDINNNDRVSKIIDSLIQINGLELNWLKYNIKNNDEYNKKSRELAFQDASEKASQYAELSKLKIVKVLSITEEVTLLNQQTVAFAARGFLREAPDIDASTVLPQGEIEVTTRILVLFLLE